MPTLLAPAYSLLVKWVLLLLLQHLHYMWRPLWVLPLVQHLHYMWRPLWVLPLVQHFHYMWHPLVWCQDLFLQGHPQLLCCWHPLIHKARVTCTHNLDIINVVNVSHRNSNKIILPGKCFIKLNTLFLETFAPIIFCGINLLSKRFTEFRIWKIELFP